MSMQGTWCDNITIQAVTNAHNCIIHIVESHVDKPDSTTIRPVIHTRQTKTIFMGYVNNLHTVSTVPISTSPNKNRLKYLKRKLRETDDQKQKKLAKRRITARNQATQKKRQMGAAKTKENVTKQNAIENAKKKGRKTNKLDEEHNKIATIIVDSINLNLKQNDDITQTEKGQTANKVVEKHNFATSADNSISLSFEQNGHETQEIYSMPIIDCNSI